jgi:hypothetical protein
MRSYLSATATRYRQLEGRRGATVAALVALACAVFTFVMVAPPMIDLCFAVASTAAWCLWLERHPDDRGRGDAR